MRADAVTKAHVECLDDPGRSFPVQFNPTSLKFGRTVTWAEQPVHGQTWSTVQFSHGGSDTLAVTLLLDESEGPGSILPAVRAIYGLTEPLRGSGGAGARPPGVAFTWEDFRFQGVVRSMEVELVLFDADGRPKRATVALVLLGRAFSDAASSRELFSPSTLAGAVSSTAAAAAGAAGVDPRRALAGGR